MGKKKPRTRQNRGVVLKVDWGCESYLDRKKVPDSNLGGYKTMRQQLASMGLAIRQIPGDGNCLFRSLADQMYGSKDADTVHLQLREETVQHMRKNWDDFEAFFIPSEASMGVTDFGVHLDLLAKNGIFAGNDAIAAFAKKDRVAIVIHQLNREPLKIGCEGLPTKELHVSYHDGNHYNSVRYMSDLNSRLKPANVHSAAYLQKKPAEKINSAGNSDVDSPSD